MTTAELPIYTKKDFQTDQEIRWCPGCGDYAILSEAAAKLTCGLPEVPAGIAIDKIAPSIGHVARNQHERHKRQELRQTHESKIERIMPNRVHLPADRDGLHLHGEYREKSRGKKPGEARMPQRRERPHWRRGCCALGHVRSSV